MINHCTPTVSYIPWGWIPSNVDPDAQLKKPLQSKDRNGFPKSSYTFRLFYFMSTIRLVAVKPLAAIR